MSPEDKIESAYRFLLGDLMPFGRNARIRLEHGGEGQSTEHYETVTYWYGLPAASLIRDRRAAVGDAAERAAHGYSSPEASAPYEITSRYEWGVDTLNGKEIYPGDDRSRAAHQDRPSEFTLRSRRTTSACCCGASWTIISQPARRGVRQRDKAADWASAGIWYLAGSNTCVYSNPKGRTWRDAHVVQTSNRRFRDDEFLIPRLTMGRSMIRVRYSLHAGRHAAFPGHPVPELAWSEMRYTAYSFVTPKFSLHAVLIHGAATVRSREKLGHKQPRQAKAPAPPLQLTWGGGAGAFAGGFLILSGFYSNDAVFNN